MVLCVIRYTAVLFHKEIRINRSSVLLIAHPDDESMFFTPFLSHHKPVILCLSGKKRTGIEESV
ncbi:hypothetical protein ECANGB1_223 [Enterospora canceri]|uniref:N-acetylglucosaminylphosphatidylinositol deacetylase n=1 Tax=Enterospora canceri TaxID=1081671 RepID=A0A1Y1S8X4_9MICR|nr:hypothetical protein ECANGB1_223 [Enterospora canceri]